MKLKRSARLVDMTRYLLEHPNQLIRLSFFSERYQAAKSSLSEDAVIVKESLESQQVGRVETVAGAAGGIKYVPYMNRQEASHLIGTLGELLSGVERVLPGGYLYMTDILGHPIYMNQVGRLLASAFAHTSADVVMTMETKGIPLAYAVASYLNIPVVIVRKDSRVTEGSTVSINYISGSSNRIQTMVLPRRSLAPDARVLIIDDFMKAGGTVKGMISMVQEFDAQAIGVGILMEAENVEKRLVEDYISVMKLSRHQDDVDISEGNVFNHLK